MTLLTFTRLPSGLRGQNANQPFGTLTVPASPHDEDFNLALGAGLSHLEQDFELPFEPREKDSAWTCGEWKIPEGLEGRRGGGGGGRGQDLELGGDRQRILACRTLAAALGLQWVAQGGHQRPRWG